MSKIYVLYSKHTCHDDTDDCAICFANSIEDAKEKFAPLYNIKYYTNCIEEVKFNKFGVAILGDY
jgi:pyruvate carboxylase